MNDRYEDLLYRSLDDVLSTDEAKELSKAKDDAGELRNDEAQLLRLRRLISKTGKVSFSPDFADRVLEKIARQEARTSQEQYSFGFLLTIFRPLIIATAIIIAVLCPLSWYTAGAQRNSDTVETITSIIDEADLAYLEEQL